MNSKVKLLGESGEVLDPITGSLIALFRALDVRDEVVPRYRLTVRIFFVGVVVVIIGATISSIVLSYEGG